MARTVSEIVATAEERSYYGALIKVSHAVIRLAGPFLTERGQDRLINFLALATVKLGLYTKIETR